MVLYFWPLVGVENIFLQERMEAKVFPDFFNNLYLMKAINVDPGYRRSTFKRKAFFDVLYFLFLKPGLIIFNKLYCGLFCFFLSNMNQRPWGKASLF